MNCFTKVQHAAFTSVSVISIFYLVDLLLAKYSPQSRAAAHRARYETQALAEAAQAKSANEPMVRLENAEASLREIVASRRQGPEHRDGDLQYYEYKLGLEQDYWDNKMTVSVMLERLKRLNDMEVDQTDPELVRIVQQFWIHPPSTEAYNLEAPTLDDFSMGQSQVVDALLKGLRGGFFVECGALDGETRSNSLFFERERGWQGLLIEAGPGNYRKMLSKHRKAYMSPSCLGVNTYPNTAMFHKGRNRGRLLDSQAAFDWVSEQHMSLSITDVQCFPLYTMLLALNHSHVDYLSLDVEGAEQAILESVPFQRLTFSVITVEFRHGVGGKKALFDLLTTEGYHLVSEVSRQDNLANDLVFVSEELR